MNYQITAKKIIDGIGGKHNIKSMYHCVTRLRFVLKDASKADTENIEKIDGVISVVESQGLYMVVIGNEVESVYEEVEKIVGKVSPQEEKENTTEEEIKKSLFDKFSSLISGIFGPVIETLAGAGLLKGVLALLVILKIVDQNGGTYLILNAAADSFFYFLPVILAVTAAKRFKVNEFLAIALSGVLIYPTIVEALSTGKNLDFMRIPVVLGKYSGTVIPIILAIWVMSYLEHFLKRKLHASVRGMLTPFLCLLIMAPLTILMVGPIANTLSDGLAIGYKTIYELNPILSGIVVGALWQSIVIFGLQWGFSPVSMNNIAVYGRDTLSAMIAPAVSGQTGATFAVFLKTKDKKLKNIALSAAITGLFGITEPALYGVNLKLKKPFIYGSVAGAIGGGIIGAAGASAMSLATKSILTLPVYLGHGFIGYVIGYFTSLVLGCLFTLIFGFDEAVIGSEQKNIQKKKLLESDNSLNTDSKIIIKSPVSGNLIKQEDIMDPVFSSNAMGAAIGIMPNAGEISSPVNGEITMVYKTKHAIGITGDSGEEVLLHIGIDTVKLNGKGFNIHFVAGQHVKVGQVIADVDFDYLGKKGYNQTVITVITNTNIYRDVLSENFETKVERNANLLTIIK